MSGHRAARWGGGIGALALALLSLNTCLRQAPPPIFTPQNLVNGTSMETTPKELAELERFVFLFTNRTRSQRQLIPLRGDATLAALARAHSDDMLRRHYFQHISPEGTSPEQRIHRGHRTLIGTTGENLWTGSGYRLEDLQGVARSIVDSWMASRGHRENLLRPEFTHLGIGIATADGGQIRATQNFATAVAYLRRPLSIRLPPGTPFHLSLDDLELVSDSAAAPRRLAFHDGHESAEPSPLGTIQIPERPGTYQLQLYFPRAAANSFLSFPGPTVEIR